MTNANPASANQSDAPTPRVSLITVCKNRLHHLRQTLPAMVDQRHAEVIVVDYGCPQGTGEWVSTHFPTVKLVHVDDDPGFCLARGRNHGAAVARGDWLMFIDADIRLNTDISLWAATSARPQSFYRAPPENGTSAWGTCVCSRADYTRLGGYDEAFRRWGGEDVDFYARLQAAGSYQSVLPPGCLTAIEHSDGERQLEGARTRAQLVQSHRVYMQVKADVTRLLGALPDVQTRTALLEQITREVIRFSETGGKKPVQLELVLNQGINSSNHLSLTRKLVYQLQRPAPDTSPQTSA